MNERIVLAVVAHPDDEVLGLGATLAKHAMLGDRVEILILAEGSTSRGQNRNVEASGIDITVLQNAARKAAEAMQTSPPRFAGFPDNRMDSLNLLDIVKVIEGAVDEIQPQIVYTHHATDLNIDHQLTHQAVLTACRPIPNQSCKSIFAFETVSSTEWAGISAPTFRPNHFVDVTATLKQKQDALDAYTVEMRPFPHARSIRNVLALASFRGASVGLEAAEAFEVIRNIQ
jgi:N-acetylglucosamine malate deacetylase 1